MPDVPAISGKLAVPVDDGLGHYDVVVYQLPDGAVLGRIPRSRHPNFRLDGAALLVNGEGGANENIWEYNADGVDSSNPGNAPFTDTDPDIDDEVKRRGRRIK